MTEDFEIIEGCQKGKTQYQKMLYQRYSGILMGICLRYTNNTADAEDILHDSFVKIFTRIKKFRFEGSFEGWLRTITTNTAIDHYNKLVQKRNIISIEETDEEESYYIEPIYETIPSNVLLQFINELPTGYRTIFNLCEIDGYKKVDVAKLLNLSDSTIRTQLMKAKKLLKTKIGSYLKNEQ